MNWPTTLGSVVKFVSFCCVRPYLCFSHLFTDGAFQLCGFTVWLRTHHHFHPCSCLSLSQLCALSKLPDGFLPSLRADSFPEYFSIFLWSFSISPLDLCLSTLYLYLQPIYLSPSKLLERFLSCPRTDSFLPRISLISPLSPLNRFVNLETASGAYTLYSAIPSPNRASSLLIYTIFRQARIIFRHLLLQHQQQHLFTVIPSSNLLAILLYLFFALVSRSGHTILMNYSRSRSTSSLLHAIFASSISLAFPSHQKVYCVLAWAFRWPTSQSLRMSTVTIRSTQCHTHHSREATHSALNTLSPHPKHPTTSLVHSLSSPFSGNCTS